jgi:hypothetical protein
MTDAAESLIAQLYSQRKITTPRREHRKIRNENEIFNANEPPTYVWELQIYRMSPMKKVYNIPVSIRALIGGENFFSHNRSCWV